MAQSKVTGVHIALIIVSMLMVIFGVAAWMTFKHASEQKAIYDKAVTDLQKQTDASRNRAEELTSAKAAFGVNLETMGDPSNPAPNTVVGTVKEQIDRTAGPSAQPTVIDALARLRQQLDTKNAENLDLGNQVRTLTAQFNALEEKYRAETQKHNDELRQRQADLNNQLSTAKRDVDEYQKQLSDADTANKDLQRKFDDMVKQKDDLISDKNVEIARLTQTNDRLSQILESERSFNFDLPDGTISNVSFETNTVWIDLGSEHNIRRGLTFSVYDKNLYSVGGRASDIKARIEVSDVLGPRLSVCNILDDDFARPISREDNIFTPLWRAGQVETFALAGDFDLDGDGNDDTAKLITLIENHGGKVGARITKKGERNDEQIDSNYRFLVIGDIGVFAKNEDEIASLYASGKKFDDSNPVDRMKLQASQAGVRFVNMTDFLAFMGYKPQRQLWRPDGLVPFNLKAGIRDGQNQRSRSDTQSTGKVSDIFNRDTNRNRYRNP